METSVRETVQEAKNQTEDRLALSICPTPLSAVSPSSATQPLSSIPSSTLPEQRLSPQNVGNGHVLGAGKKNFSGGKACCYLLYDDFACLDEIPLTGFGCRPDLGNRKPVEAG